MYTKIACEIGCSVDVLLVRVEICCVTCCWSPMKLSINVSLPLGKQPGSRPYHKKDVNWNAEQTEHLKIFNVVYAYRGSHA